MVARAFIPNNKNKKCINHKDSNRRNNKKNNLEWCTHRENTLHGIKYGKIKLPASKINKKQAKEIRTIYKNGTMNQYEIANLFKIGQAQVSRIVNFKNWID